MDGAGNGSLALIKAPRLAGFAHHNLRMDYTAVMWVTIFSKRRMQSHCGALGNKRRRLQWDVALRRVIKLRTVYRNSPLPIKRWFSHSSHPYHSFAPASECKGECDYGCVCACGRADVPVHVIEYAELLTSSEGGALMSSVPWNRPTPRVQGDWHCPVPWHTSASDGLTGPWRRTSGSVFFFCFCVCEGGEKNF